MTDFAESHAPSGVDDGDEDDRLISSEVSENKLTWLKSAGSDEIMDKAMDHYSKGDLLGDATFLATVALFKQSQEGAPQQPDPGHQT